MDVKADDLSAMILVFKNKIIGEVHLDYFQRPDFKSCKIKGTKATLYWDSNTNEIKLFYQKKRKWNTAFKLKNYDRNFMYIDQIKHFFKCVKNKKKTINDNRLTILINFLVYS